MNRRSLDIGSLCAAALVLWLCYQRLKRSSTDSLSEKIASSDLDSRNGTTSLTTEDAPSHSGSGCYLPVRREDPSISHLRPDLLMSEHWHPLSDDEIPIFCLECEDRQWIGMHFMDAAVLFNNTKFSSHETYRCPYCYDAYWKWKGYHD